MGTIKLITTCAEYTGASNGTPYCNFNLYSMNCDTRSLLICDNQVIKSAKLNKTELIDMYYNSIFISVLKLINNYSTF